MPVTGSLTRMAVCPNFSYTFFPGEQVSKLTLAESLNVKFCDSMGNNIKLRREINIALFIYCDWFIYELQLAKVINFSFLKAFCR